VSLPIEPVASVSARIAARIAASSSNAIVATDADGTLWTQDVGETTFHALLDASAIREIARAPLAGEASAHGVRVGERDDANAIARAIWDAYVAGAFPEDRVCALMAWSVAGWSLAEAERFAGSVLEAFFASPARLIEEQWELLAACADRGAHIVVVSASPTWVVQAAMGIALRARRLPIAHVVAMDVAVEGGVVLPRTEGVWPYGPGKCERVGAIVERTNARWVAAMGDNRFDAAMLARAEIGVAVRPKPALRAVAADVKGLVELGR